MNHLRIKVGPTPNDFRVFLADVDVTGKLVVTQVAFHITLDNRPRVLLECYADVDLEIEDYKIRDLGEYIPNPAMGDERKLIEITWPTK